MSDRPINRINPQGSGTIKNLGNSGGSGGSASQPPPSSSSGPMPTWTPPPLNSLADTGLNLLSVADLVLKVLYFGGYMAGHQIAEIVKLPYVGVLDSVMDFLKKEKFAEIKGTGGVGEASYQWVISGAGIAKAREALERSQYAGAAPVTLQQYVASMKAQNRDRLVVHEPEMREVLKNLTVSEDQMSRIGAAINSGRSVFMYGPPGNGKTSVAETVGRLVLGDEIWIPYAFDVDGQTVRVFDSVNHELLEETMRGRHGTGITPDTRWVKIRRPMIMVGGELTLSGLDLVYDPINKFYEAPFQVKANGGMFLIDDFGRQMVRPRDLLNRWIVPLEKGVDFLTLSTGRKIEMPFFVLIVFSTNIDPRDLVDEAFLRRIRHKVEFNDPTFDQFREIFEKVCRAKGVTYDEAALKYLLKKWYVDMNRNLRCVHPRDIINQLIDISTYYNKPPTLTKDLLDKAAASYFVKL